MTAVAEAPPKPLNVFKLNQGCHVDTAPGWERPVDEKGKPIFFDKETGKPLLEKSHVYKFNEPGNNVVRSARDLSRDPGPPEKFTRLTGDGSVIDEMASHANQQLLELTSAQQERIKQLEAELELAKPAPEKVSTDPSIAGLSSRQLDELAADEEVDLSGATRKEDKVAAIQLSRQAKAAKKQG